jgi:hypothetical protein
MDMNSRLNITEKVTDIFNWLTQNQQTLTSQPTPTLHVETRPFKRYTSDNAPTRPSRIVRQLDLLEPVTEQQKIMDLAG